MSRQPAYLKMTQIIALGVDYKNHRNQVLKMKPAIDYSNKNRDQKNIRLKQQKLKYSQARRQYNQSLMQKQNERMVKRITGISTTINTSRTDLKKSQSRKSLKSASSRDSLYSVTSNFRRRTIKHEQIRRENQKIAMRLMSPKKSNINFKSFDKSFRKDQQTVKIRSRYSDKNQQIIKSLALQGLHFKKKEVSFLPQIYKKSPERNNSKSWKSRLQTKSQMA